MRRALVAVLAAPLVLILGACSSSESVVRPLLDPGEGNYEVVSYDDADVQAMAQLAAERVAALARQEGTFAVGMRQLHETAYEVSFVSADRSPALYSGGTETASVLLSPRQAVITMSGSEGVCWAVRLSGDPAEPKLTFGSVFSPRCVAREVVTPDMSWQQMWPSRALPEPGIEYPQVLPPAVPGYRPGQLPNSVAPSQVPQQ